MATYFEALSSRPAGPRPSLAANWVMVDLAARLNREEKDIAECRCLLERLAGLIQRMADNTISNNMAKQVFEALWDGEGAPRTR